MSLKSSFIPIKPCQKFTNFKADPDSESAVTYVSLRKKGCPLKKAIHFCSKNLCKNDSTKVLDGPSDFRVLKLKPSEQLQINVKFSNHLNIFKSLFKKGWNLLHPRYNLTPFLQSHKEILQDDPQGDLLQKHFISNEDKGREDFKKRISGLAKYYRDLNSNCDFSTLNRTSLLKKLRERKKQTLEERFKKKHYYLMGKMVKL